MARKRADFQQERINYVATLVVHNVVGLATGGPYQKV